MTPPARKPPAPGQQVKKVRDRWTMTEAIAPSNPLGPDCPVRALGYADNVYYFADPVGQVRAMRANDLSANGVISLFKGEIAWLENECASGRKGRGGVEKTSWHNPTAVTRLIAACRRAGFFDPLKQTRGPGVWPYGSELKLGQEYEAAIGGSGANSSGAGGPGAASVGAGSGVAGGLQLVLHLGTEVQLVMFGTAGEVTSVELFPAGAKIGDYVYPAAATEPRPAETAPDDDELAALEAFFHRWAWRDADHTGTSAAPWLLMGWVACAAMPAVMPHRPTAWIQGGSGYGKSELLIFVRLLLQSMPLKYDNATAAGIRDDFTRHRYARPVIINEAEVQEDNRRLAGLVEMARYVYTPGEGSYRRGGSLGQATDVCGMFLFACIEPPPLLPQDANRIVMLRLGKLSVTSAEMERFEEEMPALGARLGPKIARRMIACFPMFGPAMKTFREGLIARGHTPRSANTFAVLLAGAHLLRFGAMPDDSDAAEWAGKLDPKMLATREDVRSNEGLCLMRLMTHKVAPWRGGELTPLGTYVRKALWNGDAEANRILQSFGLAAVRRRIIPADKQSEMMDWLAVANRHEGLADIFRGSRWQNGGHVEALRLIPDAMPAKAWFGAVSDRATLVPKAWIPKSPGLLETGSIQVLEDQAGEDQGGHDQGGAGGASQARAVEPVDDDGLDFE